MKVLNSEEPLNGLHNIIYYRSFCRICRSAIGFVLTGTEIHHGRHVCFSCETIELTCTQIGVVGIWPIIKTTLLMYIIAVPLADTRSKL